MPARRRRTESGARPSNAGDRYHLVYVARRLLDLLHPYSGLSQVVVENVSPADEAATDDPDAFLGVDVSEYYGGEEVATAREVNLVQVKYSPLRQAEAWTKSRLTAKKGGGESVLYKLAAMFDGLAPAPGSPGAARITVRLLTNQPLSLSLRQDLGALRARIAGRSGEEAGSALAAADGGAGELAAALQQASGLPWPRLAGFLAAWDLGGFEQSSLGRSETELFRALSGFSPDGGERLELLLGHLQLHATPPHREHLQRADVLAFLRLTESELQPAPSTFADDADLFETDAARLVRQSIELGDGRVVVHGGSGCGKTSSVRMALRVCGGGKAVLYDCYADGQGLRPGAERFPYQKCFTQVINDLEARYRTGILATVRLDYSSLLNQLHRALREAAVAAKSAGHQLVVAFDAIDNAHEQKRRAPEAAGTSFLDILWKVDRPSNCVLIVSLRTENLGEVVGGNLPDARCVELHGFVEEETRRHAERLAPVLSGVDLAFLHERTGGNPRVQRNVLEEIATRPDAEARRIIAETARRTAFEYYDQESGRRLAPADVRGLLALLHEMRQAPQVSAVAAIAGLSEAEVREVIGRVSFGLRLEAGGRVAWQNQDFLDWCGERLGPELMRARETLVNYCRLRFEQDEYARWNLSYHLHLAGRLDELVAWWREPGRLDGQIRAAHPHEERALDDLRFAISAALARQERREAFDLLLRAADLAEGRDAFAEALSEYPGIAAAADLTHLIPGGPAGEAGTGVRRLRAGTELTLSLAAELARRPECHEAARTALAAVKAEKDSDRVRDPERGGRLNLAELEDYARYLGREGGLAGALERLAEWESGMWSRLFGLAVGMDWRISGERDPLGVLAGADVGPAERAATTLGILAAAEADEPRGSALRGLNADAVEMAVTLVVEASTPGNGDTPALLRSGPELERRSGRPDRVGMALGRAVENLTAAGLLGAARRLLPLWSPPEPRLALKGELDPYVRCAALGGVLNGTVFDPATFEHAGQSAGAGGETTRLSAEENRWLGEIRGEMKRAYPCLRVRAAAWAGTAPDVVVAEVRRLIGGWQDEGLRVGERLEWSYQERATILLEALVALPEWHLATIREVVGAAQRALGASQALARVAGGEVLSRDERYLGEAESLIREEMTHCRPPAVAAREAMNRLFYLYHPAARISAALARRVIVAARDVASEIDSRIYARAEALTTIVEAAQAELEPQRLDEVCGLTAYWWSVDIQSARRAGENALRLLAARDPGAAVTRAWQLDERGLLAFETGLGHVFAGALAGRSLAPEAVWPVLPVLAGSRTDVVAREAIEQLLERGLAITTTLAAYCRLTRLEGTPSSLAESAREVVARARHVGIDHETPVQAMQAYAAAMEAALAEPDPMRRWPEDWDKPLPGQSLVEDFPGEARRLPRAELAWLEDAAARELEEMGWDGLRQVLPWLRDALPLSDRPRLAGVIERLGAGEDGAAALPLLDALLDNGGAEEPVVASAVTASVKRLLTAGTLEAVASRYTDEQCRYLLHGRWAQPGARLDAILGAMAQHLGDLGSDTLYFLARDAARLLPPEDLAQVARDFIGRTVAEAPDLGSPASPGREPRRVFPYAVALALGHRRQELRWRGVYAIVHGLVDSGVPERFLDPLLEVLDGQELPRWLSVREWLAFALEHVALRRPASLRPGVARLVPHALSRELPHAKIQHHLKQVLLAIEKSFPGSVGADLAAVARINVPVATARRQPAPPDDVLEENEQEPIDGEALVPKNYSDTVRYWYENLARCFVGQDGAILRFIVRRAAAWMAQLGITRSAVAAEEGTLGERFDWAATMNDQGSQPRVELLRLYGERHGLYLAAGELIASTPVKETVWSTGEGTEWDEWAYVLRGADPALPARFLDAPPPRADNYVVFGSPVELWIKKDEPGAYLGELVVPGEPEWVVVGGHREGSEREGSFRTEVSSALVEPRTARALARLLESGSRESFLPFFELPYDSVLPGIESDLDAGRTSEPLRGKPNAGGGLFVLKPWTVWFYQEGSLHALDPFWPRHARHFVLPSLEVVRALGWTREPTELLWRDAAGETVARCDLWRRANSDESSYAGGHRLVMRRDAVEAYARTVGLEVILSVRVRREARKDHRLDRASARDEPDPRTTRCFLWSDLRNVGDAARSGA